MSRVSAETYFELPCKKEVKFLKSYKHRLFSDKCISKLWLQSSLIACMFLCLFDCFLLVLTMGGLPWIGPNMSWTPGFFLQWVLMGTILFKKVITSAVCLQDWGAIHEGRSVHVLGSLCLCKLFGTPTSFCSPEDVLLFLEGHISLAQTVVAHINCQGGCGPVCISWHAKWPCDAEHAFCHCKSRHRTVV